MKKMVEKTCKNCSKSFEVYPYRKEASFCSRSCHYKFGFSKETREKMSAVAKKRLSNPKNHPMYKNGKWTKENKSKTLAQRERRSNRKCLSCSEHYKWEKDKSGWKHCKNCLVVLSKCKECGLDFEINKKTIKYRGVKYCSLECSRKNTCETFAERNSGENNHNWKGGINTVIAYRTRKRQAGGQHTLKQWEEVKKRYNYMCLCCKQQEPFVSLSVDHIVPLSIWQEWSKINKPNYGGNDIENIQSLCRSCNSSKGSKHVNYIIQYA